MITPLILVIDQGTHSTRTLAFDAIGQVQATASCKIALYGHGTAEVEQSATEILQSVHQTLDEVLAHEAVHGREIKWAGLTTQRSSVVAWDRETGEPLAPLLSWQDRRVAEWLKPFADKEIQVKEKTGLRLSPHYGAGKLHWYLEHVPAVQQAYRAKTLAFGPLASFLIYHLLADKALLIDHVNASRTQLWDVNSRDWDTDLADMFGVPLAPLPRCCPIIHSYGRLTKANIPLTAVNGDQNSAIYSLGRPEPDTAIINIGTGAFILALTGNRLVKHETLLSGLASSQAHQAEYLLEGTVNGAASALTWAAQQWKIPSLTDNLADWLATIEYPPVFVNTIGGLGSPWWKAGPKAHWLTEADFPAKTVAIIESIVFMLQANLQTMVDAGITINQIQVSGGLANLDGLCQRLANLTERPVYRPVQTEATARGMAWLASGQPDHWPRLGQGMHFQPEPAIDLRTRYHQFMNYEL